MKYFLALILSLVCVLASAAERVGNWEVIVDGSDVQIAKVTNSSSAVAGVICFVSTNSCSAYISAGISCEADAKYPLMLNSPTGANFSNSTCVMIGNSPMLSIDDFSSAVAAFESGGEVGFAVPMQSGQFRVIRFDCAGATAAIRQARNIPQKSPAPNQPVKNPSIQTL